MFTEKKQLEEIIRNGGSLCKANLERVDLAGANLRGADLYEAQLKNAKLQEADLTGATLLGADLRGTCFYKANLEGAYLQETNLKNSLLAGANLKDTRLPSLTMILSANWGYLSNETTLTLMRLDAATYPEGKKIFNKCMKKGLNPYTCCRFERIINFKEDTLIWSPGPAPTIYKAVCMILDEKCPGWNK
ncbi:MAG: pentapeptide repeat-containing protein [Planctomycetota bacterium]|jgi:hypothetical protein